MKSVQYKKLLELTESYKDLDVKSEISSLTCKYKLAELEELFSIDLKGKSFSTHIKMGYDNTKSINYYDGGQSGRSISWSDDGRQPEKEWLYVLSYPCGAYTFHSDYPTETFNNFIDEIKTYNPKYSDTINKSFYFSQENAKAIHENIDELFNKYSGQVKDELKQIKIKKLKDELAELNS